MNIIFLIIALIIIGYVIFPRIYLRGKKLLEDIRLKAEKKEQARLAKEAEEARIKAEKEEVERLAKGAKTSRVIFCTDKKEEEQKTDKICIVQTSERSYKFTITVEEQTKYDLSYSIRVRATHLVLSELLDIPFDQLVYHNNIPKCAYYVYDKRTMKTYNVLWSIIESEIDKVESYMRRHCK